jgi:HD superfamily phosphohydrolase
MSRLKSLRIYDALYGEVILDETTADLVWRPLVQRLRQVRLSNIDSLDMPGVANISRFEHSLGVTHLASQVGFRLGLSRHDRIALQAAALIHDTAITPFGHLAEEASRYLSLDSDHEMKWSLLLAGEEPRELGGLDRQIFLGHTSGLRDWADKTFGGSGPEMLAKIIEAIQGRGMLGPCIAGKIDLDNLDNVVRIALHMGLRPDPDLPVRIAKAMSEISAAGEIVFRDEALPDIRAWIDTREQVYGRLMPSPLDFCGKLMLTYATVSALRAGLLHQTDWHLTDSGFIDRLLKAENVEAGETVKRWLLGDLWELADLMWMRGSTPPFTALEDFAAIVSERLRRRCFAYRIKDKRKRRVTAVIESGDRIVVGESSDRWLLGVGSPVHERFTRDDTRQISVVATQLFESERVYAASTEAALF